MPLHPCGAIVDFVSTAYITKTKLWADSDELVEIRWFRAAEGAKLAPQPNPFGSIIWQSEKDPPPAHLGELPHGKVDYDRGANPLSYSGKHSCGSADAWRRGGIHGVDPVITTQANGYSNCCGALGQLGTGGVGWGGGENPAVFQPMRGGGIGGGSLAMIGRTHLDLVGGGIGGGVVTDVAPARIDLVGGGIGGGSLTMIGRTHLDLVGGGMCGGSLDLAGTGSLDLVGGGMCGGSLDLAGTGSISLTGGGKGGGSLTELAHGTISLTGGGKGGGSLTELAHGTIPLTGGGKGGGSLAIKGAGQIGLTGGGRGGGGVAFMEVPLQTIWHDEGVKISGSALSLVIDTAQLYNGYSYQNPAAFGDERHWPFIFGPGTFDLKLLSRRGSNFGKVTFYIDGTAVSSNVDFYAAASTNNEIFSLATVTLLGGAHVLAAVVPGKNASSSSWFFAPTKFWFQ